MTRIEKFKSFATHPMLSNSYCKLSLKELEFAQHFIETTQHLNDADFVGTVNRLGVIEYPEFKEFKHNTDMWALLSQCIEVKVRERRA